MAIAGMLGLGSLAAGCGGTQTITSFRTLTVVQTHTVTASQTSTTAVGTALSPATVAPKAPECSQQLQVGADGNAGPLTCSHGALNILAWAYFAKNDPLVMIIGPNAVPNQVLQAMCSDLRTSTIPIELSAYELASRYYGWRFGIDLSSEFPGACPKGS